MEFNFEEIVKHFELRAAFVIKAHHNRIWVNVVSRMWSDTDSLHSYIYRDTITIK